MSRLRIVGLVVLIVGILGLLYGGFTYTKETHDAELGPIEIRVQDRERVNIPVWAGVAATVIGGGLLAFGGVKSRPGGTP